jgi:hypothetical protein
MADLTGFEGPKCKACASRNTHVSLSSDNENRVTCCYDCGFDLIEDRINGKWKATNAWMLKVWGDHWTNA